MSCPGLPYGSRFSCLRLAFLLVLAIPGSASAFPEETPVVVDAHAPRMRIAKASGAIFSADSTPTQSRITQLAWGPGPDPEQTYLYGSSAAHGVRRMDYDDASGELANLVDVLPGISGNGIGFHVDASGHAVMYLSEGYDSANAPTRRLSRLHRITDADDDGVFGSGGDVSVVLVHGIPRDDHGLNQIQIRVDSLFVSNGVRTRNGALQTFTGDAFGESAYGGTVLSIDNLDAVPSTVNAAGFAAYLADPTDSEYEDMIDGTTPGTEAPFTSTASDKLRVHSAGTRNPFGLALDASGDLWFTSNFHRVNNSVYDRSVIDGSAEGDAFDGASNDDVHDQLFHATAKADYGYRNSNWQNDPAVQAAGFFAGIADPSQITPAFSFDNLDQDGPAGPDTDSTHAAWDAFHDPASPVGLGPHSALTGLEFGPLSMPLGYRNQIFVARWNGQFGPIIDDLVYTDVCLVSRVTGEVEQVVSGLAAPTDILADASGRLLIANYFGSIWRLEAKQVEVPLLATRAWIFLAAALLVIGAGLLARPGRRQTAQ